MIRRDVRPASLALDEGREDADEQPTHGRLAGLRRGYTRALSPQHAVYEKGGLRIDFDAYEVFLHGQRVQLFLREFEILCFFVQWPNRVLDRTEILDSVWGNDTTVDPRTIDVHIRRLRAAIERDPAHPELIVTVRRVGYKFDERVLLATAPRS